MNEKNFEESPDLKGDHTYMAEIEKLSKENLVQPEQMQAIINLQDNAIKALIKRIDALEKAIRKDTKPQRQRRMLYPGI